MKKILILLVTFGFSTIAMEAQLFPFLTDPGSLVGSGPSTALYNQLSKKEADNTKAIREFQQAYRKRQLYLVGSGHFVKQKISDEISSTFSRYDELKKRNKSLTFFSYSKKKDNKQLLVIVETSLLHLQKEVRNQKSTHVIYGEKINLLQEMMKSINQVQRMLDVVEENIEKTKLYRRIFNT